MLSHILSADYTEAPWKNGGGLTYEIAADDFAPPSWRVSIARIDRDGPFSDWSGYDRTIVALDGAQVELDVNGTRVRLSRNLPFSFAGEAKVAAYAGSAPARDLNVMTDRSEWVHDVEMVVESTRFILDDDEFAFVYAIGGSVSVERERCESGDTVVVDECESFDVAPDAGASACVIRVTPI
jgi:uncharacterized protein